MRFVSILALLSLVGCTMKPASSDDGSGGASACDGKESCNECLDCARQLACAQIISNCLNSSPCAGVDQCMVICGGDASCQQQCLINNPSGAAAYNAAQSCLYCDQCPDDCSGYFDCS
jgi:hypothetical protein